MSGGTPQRYGRRADAVGRVAATRGARFLLRSEGRDIPSVSALAAVPDWHGWPQARRARLGATAALLRHRAALDRELSAARLAPLAALVGETLFDAVCETPAPSAIHDQSGLPSPAVLTTQGQDMLARALPPVLGGAADPEAAHLVATAAALVERDAGA